MTPMSHALAIEAIREMAMYSEDPTPVIQPRYVVTGITICGGIDDEQVLLETDDLGLAQLTLDLECSCVESTTFDVVAIQDRLGGDFATMIPGTRRAA